jgi:hypothetical protein
MSVLHTGAFVLSLDLDRSVTQGQQSQRGAFGPIGSKLIAMIAARGIEATWTISEPGHSSWLEPIQAIEPVQEVGLLADANWISGTRSEFAAGLVSLAGQARSAGVSPSTLAWKTADQPEHLDLLVKQGITAVRPISAKSDSLAVGGWKGWLQGASASGSAPQTLRWGLWQIAGATDSLVGGVKDVRRAIDRAVDDRGIVHLVVDVASLATRELEVLDQVLDTVENRRAKDLLCNRTLAALAQQLTRPKQAAPAGSILRRSAA